MLVRAKFETKTIPKLTKLTELFLCNNYVYHKAGYIRPCLSFSSKLTNGKTVSWTYKNYFSCDSKEVNYISIFILEKLKILNKELKNINHMSKP